MKVSFEEKLKNIIEYAESNLFFVGLLGSIGFPIYFLIWEYLFPQPYENIDLRIICSVLFIPWTFYSKMSLWVKKYFSIYFLISAFITLPFFFSFMLIKNEFSTVWSMSFMSGLFVLILLVYDWLLVCMLTIIGFASALLAVLIIDGSVPWMSFRFDFLPIYVFALIGGLICNYRNQTASQTKVILLHSLGTSIAHEMRNPLGSIVNAMDSFTSLLPKKPTHSSDKDSYTLSRSGLIHLHQAIEQSTNVVRRGNKIIDSILTSMKGQVVSTEGFTHTSIKEVVYTALESFGYESVSDRSLIQSKLEEDFDLFCDKDLLVYVLFNLIKNSLYYKDKEKFNITIQSKQGSNFNYIIVKDTGPGIAPEKIKHIFDGFYTSGKKGGTGLGLHFCSRVIEAFGGIITCESNLGNWTEFTIALPHYESQYIQELQSKIIASKQILVVDDQSTPRLLARQYFSVWKCKIDEASSPEEALALMAKNKYDLVLMDIEMPGLRGDELTQKIRTGRGVSRILSSKYRQVPIIALTGLKDDSQFSLKRSILQHGMTDLLEKPLNPKDLPNLFDKYFFAEPLSRNSELLDSHEQMLKGKEILLVDDSPASRIFIPVFLEHTGCRVTQVTQGEEALEILEKQDFDLVVMDLEMPVMGGLEATQKIRSGQPFKRFTNYQQIPIIALTGNTDLKTIRDIKEAGMNDHLGKPTTKEELVTVIATWLAQGDNETPLNLSSHINPSPSLGPDEANQHSWEDALHAKLLNLTTVNTIKEMGSSEVISELFDAFIHESEDLLNHIEQANKHHDLKMIATLSHTIKGSAGSVGAERMQQLAEWVNQKATHNEWPAVNNWLEMLQQTHNATKLGLKHLLKPKYHE
jgi:two-component system CAI-1 autoinducer sensor kinase/phosphatase CqsS